MKVLSYMLIALLLSCSKEKVITMQKVDVGNVHFEYPSDWNLTTLKGIDSYISYLSKDEDTLWIEYGWYNAKIYNYPLKNNLFKQITIDGREAILETSRNSIGGFASLYIPKTDSLSGLYIRNRKGNIKEVLNIYKTVRIDNPKRKQFLNFDSKSYKTKSSPPGIVVYENNCLNCHSEYRYMIGPALDFNLIRSKSKQWMKQYIATDKKSGESATECSQIKDSHQINEIMKYIYR
ncbi:hypothetical protein [uncultured Chryseobacterium sp.]|uniref:hypothetical protein n=1 Tax=uncultured Chryseobacterium sp. TaxID=259322 RepID=UPI0025F95127|nr:hypothetical protein [uncultured Chryseobacterium sp.]